jgi:hypothetical protein
MLKRIIFFAGLFFLFLVIADMVLWIVISSREKSFNDSVRRYLSLFPTFLANSLTLTLLNIFFAGLAILCFMMIKKNSSNSVFVKICNGLIILTGLLAFWNLFSLM